MKVNTLTEQMLFTTVRITTAAKEGGKGYGTGFLFSHLDATGQSGNIFLVTNKHVIDGAQSAELHFIAGSGSAPILGQKQGVALAGLGSFKGHPDPDVDIAMMPIGDLLQVMSEGGKGVFYRSVSSSDCADNVNLEAYEPIEPITFIGYPDGLYDATSLLPIVRRGHSATPLTVDYEGKPIFLIDASVFPGSSGSPVFLLVPASAPDKHGNIVLGGGPKMLFLGVVAAVYQRDVPVLTTAGTEPFTSEMLDIGIVYKASAVKELASALLDGSL